MKFLHNNRDPCNLIAIVVCAPPSCIHSVPITAYNRAERHCTRSRPFNPAAADPRSIPRAKFLREGSCFLRRSLAVTREKKKQNAREIPQKTRRVPRIRRGPLAPRTKQSFSIARAIYARGATFGGNSLARHTGRQPVGEKESFRPARGSRLGESRPSVSVYRRRSVVARCSLGKLVRM